MIHAMKQTEASDVLIADGGRMTAAEMAFDLENAIARLDEVNQRIIRMKYYGGLSLREIAQLLQLPYETVKKRQTRSLKKLRGPASASGLFNCRLNRETVLKEKRFMPPDEGGGREITMRKMMTWIAVLALAVSVTACGGGETKTSGEKAAVSQNAGDAAKSGKDEDTADEKSGNGKEETKKASALGPVSLADAKQPKDSDFGYDKYADHVEVRSYSGKEEVILVPSTIENLPVEIGTLTIKSGAPVRGIVFDEGITSLPWIAGDSEEALRLEAVGIPASCEKISDSPSNPFSAHPYLKTIEVAEGNPVYSVEGGILYAMKFEDKLLMCYPAMKEGESFSQPDGTRIVREAFANTTALKRVENARPWTDGCAFSGSSVEEVICSEEWTYLGQDDFADFSENSQLRSITLSAKLDSHISNAVIFKGMDKLEEIIMPEGNEQYFTEDGVLYYVDEKEKATYVMLYPNAHPGEEFTPAESAQGIYYTSRVFENPIYLKKIHAGDRDWDGRDLPNGIEMVKP